MDECPPDNLHELGQIVIQAAIPAGETFRGPNGVSRPGRSLILKALMLQRKEARDDQRRRDLSKSIHKRAKPELRMWKTKWLSIYCNSSRIQNTYRKSTVPRFDYRHATLMQNTLHPSLDIYFRHQVFLQLLTRIICKYNFNPIYDPEASVGPYRSAGHPRLR